MLSSSDIILFIGISLPSAVVTPIVFRSAGRTRVGCCSLKRKDAAVEQRSWSECLSCSGGHCGLPKLVSGPWALWSEAIADSAHRAPDANLGKLPSKVTFRFTALTSSPGNSANC